MLIILLGVLVIPVTLLVISVTSNLQLSAEDRTISETEIDRDSSFYYIETYIKDAPYTFDSIDFVEKLYSILRWHVYNATHFQLNFTMNSNYITPQGWLLIGLTENFDANLNVIIKGSTYNFQDTFIDPYNTLNRVCFFTLQENEKITAEINLQFDYRLNGQSTSGMKKYTLTIFDPTHNDALQSLLSMITLISVFGTMGMTITTIIAVLKNKKKAAWKKSKRTEVNWSKPI